MIVMQIMKVLPAGAHFKILDEYKPVLEGSIAMADKSVMFKDINDDLKYQKYLLNQTIKYLKYLILI